MKCECTLFACLVFASAMSVALTLVCPRAEAESPAVTYRIVFECQDEAGWDLCVMDSNGSNREFLLRSPETEAVPIVSPDRGWIAFTGEADDVCVIGVDGTGKRNLTNTAGYDQFLSWSPDSRYVMLATDNQDLPGTPFVDIHTGETHALPFVALGATWSPDGRRVAYQGTIGAEDGLYARNLDGSAALQVVDPSQVPGTPQWPKWAPDGQRIAFKVGRPSFESSIYVVGADGSDLTLVSGALAQPRDPFWSPDGTRLLFSADEPIGENAYSSDLYVVKADGTGLRQLTNAPGLDQYPAWSPDGQKIAFASRRDGPFQIYVMNSDGSEQRRLTHTSEHEQFPCWVVDTRPVQSTAASGWSGGRAHLTGQVVDAGTGLPIEGALVELGSRCETTTGVNGDFEMQVPGAREDVLRVKKDGYQTYTADAFTVPSDSTVNLRATLTHGSER